LFDIVRLFRKMSFAISLAIRCNFGASASFSRSIEALMRGIFYDSKLAPGGGAKGVRLALVCSFVTGSGVSDGPN